MRRQETGLAPAGLASAQGLYDSSFEHDACGVGFVADLTGRRDHDIVAKALTVLPAGTLNVPYSSSLTTGGSYPFQDAILSLGAYPPGINSPVSSTSTLDRSEER